MLNKAQIKHFAKVGAGQGAPQQETDFSKEGIPFIRAGSLEDLLNGKDENELPKVKDEIAKKYKLKLYKPDTIIFAKSGMSSLKGRIYKLKNFCYVVNHLATLELLNNADADYVVYALRYFSPVKLINDNAYPSLKQSVIENYEIPFPKEKKVQIHIANVLSKAESLIAHRKESIRLLDEYLKSTFLDMFGDPAFNYKNWKKIKFKELIVRGDKINYGVIQPGEDGRKEGIAIIRVGDFDGIRINSSNLKLIDPAVELKHKSSRLVGDEVLIACVGATIGKIALADISHAGKNIVRAIARVRCDSQKVNRLYLCHLLLTSFYQFNLKNLARTIAQPTLNIGQIEELKIIVPTIELQNQFALIVKKAEALKARYQKSLQELENFYGSLSQNAFKGELVFPQNGEEQLNGEVETDKINVTSKKIVSIENEKKEKDEVVVSIKSTKKIIPNLQPVPTYREKTKQSYKIINTIKTHYRNRYFTYEELSKKLIESGHVYKFEAIRNEIFNLLRDNKLRQIFADAAFKSSFDKSHPDYDKVQELKERIYLTLKSEQK